VSPTPSWLQGLPSLDLPSLGQWVSMSQGTIIMYVSPLNYWVEHVDKTRVCCHQSEGWASISTSSSENLTILCNLKFHVVTKPMFVCPRKSDSHCKLQYKFPFSFSILSICESICLSLCNHKKDSGWMFWSQSMVKSTRKVVCTSTMTQFSYIVREASSNL
jgi:hypothetical protein